MFTKPDILSSAISLLALSPIATNICLCSTRRSDRDALPSDSVWNMDSHTFNTRRSSDGEQGLHADSPYYADRRNTEFGSNWAREERNTSKDISRQWRTAAPAVPGLAEPSSNAWRPRTRSLRNTVDTASSSELGTMSTGEANLLSLMPPSRRESLEARLSPSKPNDSPCDSPLEANPHRRQMRAHSLAELAPGVVIRALHISEALAPRNFTSADWATQPNRFKIPFDNSRAIAFKVRFFVVVKVLEGLYQAVPIFTKDGKGLANVPKVEHNNYMAIRDHRSDEFECQNDDLPVLETVDMASSTVLIHPKAVVMFNSPSTFWVQHPFEIHGRLTCDSTATLIQHCRRYGDEEVEQPSEEMIVNIEHKLRSAKIAQLEYKAVGVANANQGFESKNGPRHLTPSPPSKDRIRPRRSSSASEALPQFRNLAPCTTDRRPSTASKMTYSNAFGALAINEESDSGNESA